jgi:hypothetical protein
MITPAMPVNDDAQRATPRLGTRSAGRKTIVLNRPALEIRQAHPRGGSYVICGAHPDWSRSDLKKPWSLHAAGGVIGITAGSNPSG